MSFKFSVGQAVEYTPIGEKKAGLYKIASSRTLMGECHPISIC